MRAIVQQVYGSAAMLAAAEVGRPSAGAGEVLVRVRAASVNARDWHVMRGDPKIARWMDRSVFGRHGPANPVQGGDFAGTVEAVGDGVADVAVGEEVFGEAVSGAFAEYIALPRALLDRKPAN
ncbi:alcohol dehydrogenase catalytic domain-containing protein, partial [Nocardia salmonicida]|uniref:alcohol dehydrogenase catalytic domain-containing protein n=1 Tax=Nocardia salmonicida TaxID=53431 RepID=UPI00364D9F2D